MFNHRPEWFQTLGLSRILSSLNSLKLKIGMKFWNAWRSEEVEDIGRIRGRIFPEDGPKCLTSPVDDVTDVTDTAVDPLERNELEGFGNPENWAIPDFAVSTEVNELDDESWLHGDDWKEVGAGILGLNGTQKFWEKAVS